jgi:hypothetical protein
MIDSFDYFKERLFHKEATSEVIESAQKLLRRVNALLLEYESRGGVLPINPKTETLVSGKTEGGFRLQACKQGARRSSHKTGEGVDIYDPNNDLDEWINNEALEAFDLYREHPSKTKSWVHLSTRPPRSRNRTFYP